MIDTRGTIIRGKEDIIIYFKPNMFDKYVMFSLLQSVVQC